MPAKDSVKITGELRIQVIDRKTGEVKKEVRQRNAVLSTLAGLIRGMLAGQVPGTYYINDFKITTIALGRQDKSTIKKLSNPKIDLSYGTGYYSVVVSVQDTSTDAYTVYYVSMGNDTVFAMTAPSDVTANAYFAQALTSAISKGSGDVLNIQWEVKVSYGSV